MSHILTQQFLEELKAEESATRKCLERIPESLFEWKPHERSMKMGYLSLLLADVPKWIVAILEKGEVNFGTWEKYEPKTTEDVLKRFEENIQSAKTALENATDESLEELFYLRAGDKELMKDSKKNSVSSSLNHWVHHRGQLTVYMRLNDIMVPSIYGPSADDGSF